MPRGPLATILAARRPKVGDGRFGIRVRFARSAPAGTAVVEVIRTRRVIGIARARVLRGGTKRIRVKLTPSGRRQLAEPVRAAHVQGPRTCRAARAAVAQLDSRAPAPVERTT